MNKDLLNSPTDGSIQGSMPMQQYSASPIYSYPQSNSYAADNLRSTAKKNCGCGGTQNGTSPNTLNNGSDAMQQVSSSMPYQPLVAMPQYTPVPDQQLPQVVLAGTRFTQQSGVAQAGNWSAMGADVGAARIRQELATNNPYPYNQ